MKSTAFMMIQSFVVLIAVNALAGPIPDTGQTKCYNNTEEIPCPQPGEAFYGQDGNYLINPPSYTKLDAEGSDLPDDATEWVMVRDNVTGLIWEAKTNDASIHDKDNVYTWCDTNPETNSGNAGICGDGTDTEYFLKVLNSWAFGGHSDWRLPFAQELRTIAKYNSQLKAIETQYFPLTKPYYYWTSLSAGDTASHAWLVYFANGFVGSGSKAAANKYHIRAVPRRQVLSASRFRNNGDGTTTDTVTGLMWQQDTPESGMDWQSALSYCAGIELAGHADWRLPTIKEIASLIDYGKTNPAIDVTFIGDTESDRYWSSTTREGAMSSAWSGDLVLDMTLSPKRAGAIFMCEL